MKITDAVITENVTKALDEDISSGDLTSLLISSNEEMQMNLLIRESAVLCGQAWFDKAFKLLDGNSQIEWQYHDGDKVTNGKDICTVRGNARALLSAERTALNFLQTLSATATVTMHYQQLVAHTACRILDTRKTIPNLRMAQKYAVQCGGGTNHRIGLFDAFLLKENHLSAAGNLNKAIEQARIISADAMLEVEVETLDQLKVAIEAGVDRIMLDNFNLEQMRDAVAINRGRVELEASGNIDQTTIKDVAETGVDFISIGALTKHIRAIDFSLRYSEK